MERESNQMQALCRSGCGFYGSPATDGLCSLCYKEALKKKQQLPTNTPASLSSLRPERESSAVAAAAAAAAAASGPLTSAAAAPVVVAASAVASSDPPSHQPPAVAAALDESAAATVAVAAAAAAASQLDADESSSSSTTGAAAGSDSSSDDRDGDKDSRKKKNRCAMCRKKVGLTGFECRCGGLFCAVHRYSDKHDCSFNYREMGAQEIRRNNPVVVGEKIQKI